MKWPVEYTHEFGEWWDSLDEGEQERVDASVRLLEELGLRPAKGGDLADRGKENRGRPMVPKARADSRKDL